MIDRRAIGQCRAFAFCEPAVRDRPSALADLPERAWFRLGFVIIRNLRYQAAADAKKAPITGESRNAPMIVWVAPFGLAEVVTDEANTVRMRVE